MPPPPPTVLCLGGLEVRKVGGSDSVGSRGEAGFYPPAVGSPEALGGGVGAENPLLQPVGWRLWSVAGSESPQMRGWAVFLFLPSPGPQGIPPPLGRARGTLQCCPRHLLAPPPFAFAILPGKVFKTGDRTTELEMHRACAGRLGPAPSGWSSGNTALQTTHRRRGFLCLDRGAAGLAGAE